MAAAKKIPAKKRAASKAGPAAASASTLDRVTFGKRLRAESWPAGTYRGTVEMLRGAGKLGEQTVTLTIAP